MARGIWRPSGCRLAVAGLLAGIVLSGGTIAADLDLRAKPPAQPAPPSSAPAPAPVSPSTPAPPAAATPAPSAPAPAAAAPAAPATAASVEELLATVPNCAEATDKCRVCLVSSAGKPVCSNVGIACEPQKWTCLRTKSAPPQVEPKKEQSK